MKFTEEKLEKAELLNEKNYERNEYRI